MNEVLATLKENMINLNARVQDIYNLCDAENRDPNAEEVAEIEDKMSQLDQHKAEVERRERFLNQTNALLESVGRKAGDEAATPQASAPRAKAPAHIEIVEPTRGNNGFRNFGEFALSVKNASMVGNTPDHRLFQNAPTTYGQEGVGADGGFLVPPDYRTEIARLVESEESILGRTDQYMTESNRLEVPVDETTDWQTSGGIQTYWASEAAQLTQSKPALQSLGVALHKLTVLVPVTEELLQDASVLDRYVRNKALSKIDFAISNAIIRGTGAGQPLGILNGAATVTVAKESGQAADTIVYNNILNMWSRCYAPCRRMAVWVASQDVEPALMGLAFKDTADAGPVYLPNGNLAGSPFPTLLGRPVLYHQVAETLGDKGDLMLVDFSKYLTAMKTQGVRQDVSMHLYFDYDMMAFRFIFRIAGQPWYSNAITQRDGSNTLSPYVVLAERA